MMAHTGTRWLGVVAGGGSDDSCHRIVCVVRLVYAAAFLGFEGVSVG